MATAAVSPAYEQVILWDQRWQATEMSKPLRPLNDTDAVNNNGIQDPLADYAGTGNLDVLA